MPRKSTIAVGQPRISCGVGWIAVDRLLKILLRLLHALARSLVPVVAAFQVRLICILRHLARSNEPLVLSSVKRNPDFFGDSLRHIAL